MVNIITRILHEGFFECYNYVGYYIELSSKLKSSVMCDMCEGHTDMLY